MSTYATYFKISHLYSTNTATTDIFTLSLHDALPISRGTSASAVRPSAPRPRTGLPPLLKRRLAPPRATKPADRKSTRLNSSHVEKSYAVFCLKKKRNHAKTLGA